MGARAVDEIAVLDLREPRATAGALGQVDAGDDRVLDLRVRAATALPHELAVEGVAGDRLAGIAASGVNAGGRLVVGEGERRGAGGVDGDAGAAGGEVVIGVATLDPAAERGQGTGRVNA